MDEKENQIWGMGKCEDCGLLDSLYKGFCKPCFDKRGMEYDPKDLEDLKPEYD